MSADLSKAELLERLDIPQKPSIVLVPDSATIFNGRTDLSKEELRDFAKLKRNAIKKRFPINYLFRVRIRQFLNVA